MVERSREMQSFWSSKCCWVVFLSCEIFCRWSERESWESGFCNRGCNFFFFSPFLVVCCDRDCFNSGVVVRFFISILLHNISPPLFFFCVRKVDSLFLRQWLWEFFRAWGLLRILEAEESLDVDEHLNANLLTDECRLSLKSSRLPACSLLLLLSFAEKLSGNFIRYVALLWTLPTAQIILTAGSDWMASGIG